MPSYRRFLTPLQQMAFWKQSDKRRISPFATIFSTFSYRLSIQFYLLRKHVQSRLLQNCCMKERVKLYSINHWSLFFIFLKTFCPLNFFHVYNNWQQSWLQLWLLWLQLFILAPFFFNLANVLAKENVCPAEALNYNHICS